MGHGTSYGFATPVYSGLSINLNDLKASTTYDYEITVENNCATRSSYTNSFGTPAPPTNTFSGWVEAIGSHSDGLDQVTGAVSTASIDPIWAICESQGGSVQRYAFPSNGNNIVFTRLRNLRTR